MKLDLLLEIVRMLTEMSEESYYEAICKLKTIENLDGKFVDSLIKVTEEKRKIRQSQNA